ncbi:hypothetical protein HanPI659440_Chr11g0415961 [Helianthus annuus]|nr:hypothetical protein HanPI659440_Chr11g0415961 [Helianthus annuus]
MLITPFPPSSPAQQPHQPTAEAGIPVTNPPPPILFLRHHRRHLQHPLESPSPLLCDRRIVVRRSRSAVVVFSDTHNPPFSRLSKQTTTTVRWWCGGYKTEERETRMRRERETERRENRRRRSRVATHGGDKGGDGCAILSDGFAGSGLSVIRVTVLVRVLK